MNNSTIDILEVYAQHHISDGRPFPPDTQFSHYLRPGLIANFAQTFVICLQLLLLCIVMQVYDYIFSSL